MEWQPIETAPKDGTRILLWIPERKRYFRSFWYSMLNGWANQYGNGLEYKWGTTKRHPAGYLVPDHIPIEPSHWMPDIAPPDSQV